MTVASRLKEHVTLAPEESRHRLRLTVDLLHVFAIQVTLQLRGYARAPKVPDTLP